MDVEFELVHNKGEFKVKVAGNEIRNIVAYNIACNGENSCITVDLKLVVSKENASINIDTLTQLQSRQSVNPLEEMKDAFKEALSQATYDTVEE